MLGLIIIILYCIFLFFIALFSFGQLALIVIYLKNRTKQIAKIELVDFPQISVQLPIYNEKFVVERLISAVSKLNYPKEKLEIQILNDSNDETSEIIRKMAYDLKKNGFIVEHIQREDRIGFKAGALQNGLKLAKGEFIAIFDADFIPDPNFLMNSLVYFSDEKIGMVQTRWGHINPKHSWLTRAQEIGLNCHFIIDQEGRSKGGYFINFNGTAGIWRKKCIIDAGAWEADTLTEDLDLSYRAQMKGWKFTFCPELISPAELPIHISALRSQQFRWIKGGVETSKKLLRKLWECNIPIRMKLLGSFHLLNNYIYGFILITALLSVPLMVFKNHTNQYIQFFNWSTLLLFILLINFAYCFITINRDKKNILGALKEIFIAFPISIIVSMGMSYHNLIAVLKGIQGKKSSFIRTPKLNEFRAYSSYKSKQKLSKYFPELILSIFFAIATVIGIYYRDIGFPIYHGFMCIGFGYIFYRASTE